MHKIVSRRKKISNENAEEIGTGMSEEDKQRNKEYMKNYQKEKILEKIRLHGNI